MGIKMLNLLKKIIIVGLYVLKIVINVSLKIFVLSSVWYFLGLFIWVK